jgi:hypothetical protein
MVNNLLLVKKRRKTLVPKSDFGKVCYTLTIFIQIKQLVMRLSFHFFLFLLFIAYSNCYFVRRFSPLPKVQQKSLLSVNTGDGFENGDRIDPTATSSINRTKINALIGYKFSRPHTIKVINSSECNLLCQRIGTGNAACFRDGSSKGIQRIP